jgi:hypothetical protein
MAVIAVPLTSGDARLALLIPLAAQRIEEHAHTYQPEVIPEEYARAAVSRVWGGDPDILLMGLVNDETAQLVGHVLAILARAGTATRCEIVQAKADENVGDALTQAVETVIKWATVQKIARVMLNSSPGGKEWEKRLGFRRYRSVLRLPLEGDADRG